MGKRGNDTIFVKSLGFSSDSKHVAYYAGDGNKGFIVVDSKEGEEYDGVIAVAIDKNIIFDSSESMHYLGIKKPNIFLVEEIIRRIKFNKLQRTIFSVEQRHHLTLIRLSN